MKEGDVILTPIPQANGMVKNRPAIVLREMPPFNDLLVYGVSSHVKHYVKGFDELISASDKDFERSGLLTDPVIRFGFLAVLSRKDIIGSIESISEKRHRRLLKTLSNYLIQ